MAEVLDTSRRHPKPGRRWFGFGRTANTAGADGPAPAANDVARAAREERRELLAAISSFLLDHELAVTPANLAFAWSAFSGASPNLNRKIAEKSHRGETVEQDWIDASAPAPFDERQDREARALLDDLNNSVRQFTRSTTAARNATSAYNQQLDEHVAELSDADADVLSHLASLARRMAERTREVEAELKASEHEAKLLRRRLDKARREADRDHLTGLPNRRAFELELDRQYAAAEAAGEPLSIAFCDIDNFKHINDRHGHDAGDRVLRLVAQILAASSSDNCHVSRHGGEEFVLLFRGLTPAAAKERLDLAREDISGRRLLNKETNQPFGQITFSAGVADVLAHDDPRDALKAADGALYRAKQGGRNQVLTE